MASRTLSSTPASTISPTSGNTLIYKGKVTHRSWAQLPEELVRTIATYFIWDVSVSNYCPDQWQIRAFWHNRMVYTALRDAQDVEKFMQICPQWEAAMETHLFWHHAITLIDPHDSLGVHAWVRNNNSSAPPTKLSPYQHFRNITRWSCFVCRINIPHTNQGLANGKRTVVTRTLGTYNVCRDHDRTSTAYCGLCFREGQTPEVETNMNPNFTTGCLENEDPDFWPNIEATCRACRGEWLWREACAHEMREAIGGRRFNVDDWEAKSTIEGFVDLGEGRIAEILLVAKDRHWIRNHTKLGDMLSQALAASRFDGREERLAAATAGEDTEMDLSETEDDDEDDFELAQLTEDSGIRELALGDWVRNRILDGFWISPADQHYNNVQPDHPWDVRAVHPCPWTVEEDDPMEQSQAADEHHPKVSTTRGPIPPSYHLCEQTYQAHQKQMRMVLLPAMKNIVRRVVIESNADGVDPAIRAARMSLEDVMSELRDEANWFEGVDWLERRRNARREAVVRAEAHSDDHSTSSNSSKSSDESSTVSPVLSSTTLQTTPSPPPLEEKKTTATPSVPPSVTIAVAPVLNPPRLLHSIPYVPVTAAHLPHYSLEAFRNVWREACTPLYHCRCKICERAQAQANATSAVAAGAGAVNQQPVPEQPTQTRTQNEIVEIKLGEADAEGDLEMEEDPGTPIEEMDYADYAEFDSEFDGSQYDGDSRSRSRSPPRLNRPLYNNDDDDPVEMEVEVEAEAEAEPVRPRKRSCDEIDDGRVYGHADDEGGYADDDYPEEQALHEHPRARTPPKRIRRGEGPERLVVVDDPATLQMKHKRSNLELMDAQEEEEPEGEVAVGKKMMLKNKRAKMSEEAESPPTSLTAEDSEHSSAADLEEVEEYGRKGLRVIER